VFASAKICPNLSEPHSQEFGYDVVERPFKLLSNKCFVISDYVTDMHKLFPHEIVYGKNPEDFMQKIKMWLGDDMANERRKLAQAGHFEVMRKHTYFHRIMDVMKNLDLPDEVVKCELAFEDTKERLKI